MCEWKKSVYGKSLYLLLNFAGNLQLFSKKKKKKSTIIVVILYHSVNILKSTDVYTLKGGIRCYMN